MEFDYTAFVEELKKRKAIPMIIVYAVETEDKSVNLDWMWSPAYDDANTDLKKDTIKITKALTEGNPIKESLK